MTSIRTFRVVSRRFPEEKLTILFIFPLVPTLIIPSAYAVPKKIDHSTMKIIMFF
jgi:hypothetical protein